MTDKVLASSAETSPDALLKQAILGARASAEKAAKPAIIGKPAMVAKTGFRIDSRLAGLSAAALGLGALMGAGAMSLATQPQSAASGEALAQVRQQVEAARNDSERQIERLGKSLAQLQESADAARSEAKTRSAALTERVGRAEQSITTKMSALGDRLEQAEKDQTGRLAALTTQIEKRAAPVAATPLPAPQAAKAIPPEPTETGALADKPKPAPTENWAVREVYDGIAVLEDRKRRLVEVGPGDTVPGVGRIEGIERRGKTWVVVTKQGTITPQAW
ncbi:hypothetical protein [Methylobacterium sp. J-068]|uniref:hypothetical protein n=1 Tax=Methylobacterium sp. J-068 TaxID=2836649 RepID=UPI001FB872CD|nr:hypothetical protein [Methylobacterium sp. J-068]MCJ2034660.1 hypothetical protein [Methylobacterium sp. J-068]